jgi:hypothetical protein
MTPWFPPPPLTVSTVSLPALEEDEEQASFEPLSSESGSESGLELLPDSLLEEDEVELILSSLRTNLTVLPVVRLSSGSLPPFRLVADLRGLS